VCWSVVEQSDSRKGQPYRPSRRLRDQWMASPLAGTFGGENVAWLAWEAGGRRARSCSKGARTRVGRKRKRRAWDRRVALCRPFPCRNGRQLTWTGGRRPPFRATPGPVGRRPSRPGRRWFSEQARIPRTGQANVVIRAPGLRGQSLVMIRRDPYPVGAGRPKAGARGGGGKKKTVLGNPAGRAASTPRGRRTRGNLIHGDPGPPTTIIHPPRFPRRRVSAGDTSEGATS